MVSALITSGGAPSCPGDPPAGLNRLAIPRAAIFPFDHRLAESSESVARSGGGDSLSIMLAPRGWSSRQRFYTRGNPRKLRNRGEIEPFEPFIPRWSIDPHRSRHLYHQPGRIDARIPQGFEL